MLCGFCGIDSEKHPDETYMISGVAAAICNKCIIKSAGRLALAARKEREEVSLGEVVSGDISGDKKAK